MGNAPLTGNVLQQASFRSWLEQKSNEIVGYTGSSSSCPIAQWLGATRGQDAWVLNNEYQLDTDLAYRPLPIWAALFVSSVDTSVEIDRSLPILGREALAILDQVTSSEKGI